MLVPKQLNGVLNRVGYFGGGELFYLQNKKANCIFYARLYVELLSI